VSFGNAYRCDRCGETTELIPPDYYIFQQTPPLTVTDQLRPPFGWSVLLRANEDHIEGSFWHLCMKCTDAAAVWIAQGDQ